MNFSILSRLSAGAALGLLMTGTALADPGLIYDLGGKFDKSFNEAAYNGAERWKAATGGNYLDFEITDGAQREQALRRMVSQGANPIVVMSFNWGSVLPVLADEYPDVKFVVIDSVVEKPNVRSVVFDEHTGSFLVGALAALKSETGKYGFVGGMDVPLIHKFYCGYAQGVKAVRADAEVYENYTGTTPDAWNNPTVAGELAKAAYDRGAEVVFAAAGGSGLGVIQAAQDNNKFAIGVDSNQNHIAPGFVLTSMEKRVDVAVETAFTDGPDLETGLQVLGLAENGVGYSVDDNNRSLLTDEMIAQVEDYKAKIIAGEITVHNYETDSQCPL
ncbi:nucleoside-binding protein [Devosia enhydra]|uniref:Nucleoside-binding protein n=1 Tax=Devosia enhydra TaxID=665118 RepID=A0A1K2HXF3_9HYPH|nr:BMP family ABC transporter substrate-binding protein [Devosia enhydra]SFZ84336.1 nucleoside-binding protein [Devosia enhydra]